MKLWVGAILVCLMFQAYPLLAAGAAPAEVPVDVCDSIRLKDKCRPAPMSVEDNMAEQKIPGRTLVIKKQMSLPEQEISHQGTCEAHYQITYAQMNDHVKVETTIENTGCGPSRGEYVHRVRTLAENGEPVTRSFPNNWSRTDEHNVQATSYYPMGDSQDLIWVKVRARPKTSCVCAN